MPYFVAFYLFVVGDGSKEMRHTMCQFAIIILLKSQREREREIVDIDQLVSHTFNLNFPMNGQATEGEQKDRL